MNERIRDLAITGGIYDCICDPYDKLKNGDPYSSVMVDLERFAEKIVRECAGLFLNVYVEIETEHGHTPVVAADYIKKHFGVEP